MILAVCFMKINELLSGLWEAGAGGRLAPLQLPDGLSAYQLTVSLSPYLSCTPPPPLPFLLSSLLSAPVEAPKTLFTQLDLAISYSCVSLSELL